MRSYYHYVNFHVPVSTAYAFSLTACRRWVSYLTLSCQFSAQILPHLSFDFGLRIPSVGTAIFCGQGKGTWCESFSTGLQVFWDYFMTEESCTHMGCVRAVTLRSTSRMRAQYTRATSLERQVSNGHAQKAYVFTFERATCTCASVWKEEQTTLRCNSASFSCFYRFSYSNIHISFQVSNQQSIFKKKIQSKGKWRKYFFEKWERWRVTYVWLRAHAYRAQRGWYIWISSADVSNLVMADGAPCTHRALIYT